MALVVKRHFRINPFQAQYRGTVVAPAFMAGKEVRVNLTNYAAWQLRDCKSAEQAVSAIQRLGFDSVREFERDIEEIFSSMSIPDTLAVFQGCLPGDADDLWGCWIGDPVGSKPPNDAIYGYARVLVKTAADRNPRATADFLFTDRAVSIKTLADFVSFFRENMSPEIDGCENNANCLFRIKSAESPKVVTFWSYVAREEVSFQDGSGRVRSFNVPASLEKTWEQCVVKGEQSAGLCRVVAAALGQQGLVLSKPEHAALAADIAEGLSKGEILIEAIPGQRHRLIGDVLKGLSKEESHINQTINMCRIGDGDKDFGFYPMIGITNTTFTSSSKYVEGQSKAVVLNKLFHDDSAVAVRADSVPVAMND